MNEVFLSIDTSSPYSFVSVYKKGQFVSESFFGETSHNEEIDRLVKAVAARAEIQFSELSGLILGSGPGSFTGLRISFAYMKGLAFALKLPLYQYSSIESCIYSFLAEPANPVFCSISDARRGEYFVSLQQVQNDSVKAIRPTQILSVEQVLKVLKELDGQKVLVNCSPGTGEEFSMIESRPLPQLSESIVQMHLHEAKFAGSENSFDLQKIAIIEPFYLREVAAKTLKDRGITLT